MYTFLLYNTYDTIWFICELSTFAHTGIFFSLYFVLFGYLENCELYVYLYIYYVTFCANNNDYNNQQLFTPLVCDMIECIRITHLRPPADVIVMYNLIDIRQSTMATRFQLCSVSLDNL